MGQSIGLILQRLTYSNSLSLVFNLISEAIYFCAVASDRPNLKLSNLYFVIL